ncbi:MAG: hypothetical protein ICV87_06825 [Gemmatimonadetes bacterium]|nr:hypothetical protein [Gemmatimonadota bacterium]
MLKVKPVKGPEPILGYVGSVARLALVRLPELVLFEKRRSRWCELAVATEDGLFVRVKVAAHSSRRAGIERVECVPELRWHVPVGVVNHARASISPVILLLIDKDTEHGRYARLDTLPAPPRGSKTVAVGFPRANISSPANLERLIAEIRARRQQPAASSAA